MTDQGVPASRKKRQPLRQRHVPQRTCVACHRTAPKRELVRIVRGMDGAVQVDPTGKKSGRGAYLCRNFACWELAFRRRAIEHALSTTITPEEKAALLEYAEQLRPEGSGKEGHI